MKTGSSPALHVMCSREIHIKSLLFLNRSETVFLPSIRNKPRISNSQTIPRRACLLCSWQWTIQWRNPSFFWHDVSIKEGSPRQFKCTATQTKGRPSFVVPTTTVQTHVDWHLIAFCFFFRFCLVRRTLFEPTKIGLTFESKSQQTMRAKMSREKAQSSLSVPIYDRSPIGEVQDIVLWYLEATKVDLQLVFEDCYRTQRFKISNE